MATIILSPRLSQLSTQEFLKSSRKKKTCIPCYTDIIIIHSLQAGDAAGVTKP